MKNDTTRNYRYAGYKVAFRVGSRISPSRRPARESPPLSKYLSVILIRRSRYYTLMKHNLAEREMTKRENFCNLVKKETERERERREICPKIGMDKVRFS